MGAAAFLGSGVIAALIKSGHHSLPEPQGQVAGPEYREATIAAQPAPRTVPVTRNGAWTSCVEGGTGASPQGLDLVLVIDTTGSMGGVIGEIKLRLAELLASLKARGGTIRVGLVAYRDYVDAGTYVVRSFPLTNLSDVQGASGLTGFVASLQAAGGGDWPEAMAPALNAAASMNWRGDVPASIVVVADAPPHASEETMANAIAQEFRTKIPGGQVSLVDAGSGAHPAMRKLPEIGGGQYVTYNGQILNSLFPAITGCKGS